MYISFITLCPFHFHFTTKPKTESGKYPNVRIATIPSPHQMLLFVWLFSFENFFFQFTIFRHRIFPDTHTERISAEFTIYVRQFYCKLLAIGLPSKMHAARYSSALFFFFFIVAGVELKLLATKNFHSILKPALLHFNSNSDQICCIENYMVPKLLLCIFFSVCKNSPTQNNEETCENESLTSFQNISLCWNWVFVFASN